MLKMLLPIALLVIVLVAAVLIRFRKGSPGGLFAKRRLTLERKLEILAGCGLQLAEPFSSADLAKSWNRELFEKPGFDMALVGLGMTEERKPWRAYCVNLWNLDRRCIERHGDYKRIAERMVQMTQGTLILKDIKDHVDIKKEIAWFSFLFRGRRFKVNCKVENDLLDTGIFASFVKLLKVADPSRVYIYYDLGGQDCIIGCVLKEELKMLNKRGIKFALLT